MILKTSLILSFLFFISASSVAQEASSSVPASVERALGKGINMPYWVESEGDPDIPASRFLELKDMGITHVRLPVNPSFLIENKERAYMRLDEAVQRINDAGLLAIVDFHPRSPFFRKYAENSSDTQRLIIRLWRDLAEHLVKTTSPEKVVLELYNEPNVPSEEWPALVANLVHKVRAKAPKYTLLVGGTYHNAPNELYKLPALQDANLVYVFHYYRPSIFTHQGASWDPLFKDVSGLTFPPQRNDSMRDLVDTLTKKGNETAAKKLKGYLNHSKVEEDLVKEFEDLGEWGRKNGVKILMSEFGVVDTAPPEDRARWIRTVRTQAEKNGIGWSLWSYGGTFGLYKKDADGDSRLNPEVAQALGLSH